MAKSKPGSVGGGGGGIEETFVEEGKAVIVTDKFAKFHETEIPGRDGTGPYLVLDNGVVLPDGSLAPVGATFCAGTEKVCALSLEQWQAAKLVRLRDATKEFKGDIVEKG
jgi:hypothetical protein